MSDTTGPAPAEHEFHILGDWLTVEVGSCTCAAPDVNGQVVHERGCGLEPVISLGELETVLRRAGRTVVELPEPANGYRYGRAWRRTDAEPPADVTLLRNSAHPGTFDADMPGPYVKRTPSGDWWFVARPDEDTDPEGWPWAGLFDQQDAIWFEVVAAESSGDGESRG